MPKKEKIIISLNSAHLSKLPRDSYEVLDGDAPPKMKPETIAKLEQQVFDFLTISKIGRSLLSIQKIDQLSHVFLSSVYEASEAANCALFLYDTKDESFKCIKAIGLDPEVIGEIKFKKEEGLFWQVLNSGEPFPIIDSFGNHRFESVIKKWNLGRIKSQVWVPLIVKKSLIGVLTLGMKKDGGIYQETELSFILQMCNQAAIALETAMLDEQKERASKDLAKKMKSLAVLYSVSRALNFSTDLKKMLLFILDKARDTVGAQKASLMLLDTTTDELVVHAARGVPPDIELKINKGLMECTRIKLGEGIAGRVAISKKYMLVNNVKNDDRFQKSTKSYVESIICMPLIANDESIGVINLTNKKRGGKFNQEDVEVLSALAGQAAITIHNARLYHMAITDGLTQLRIHRYLQQRLDEELARSSRFKRPLSLIISDIDNFKNFNDTYGHQQGDIILMETAKIFRQNVREIDIVARYGGEEFAVILPETALKEALVIAERIREQVEAYEYPSKQGKLKTTISLGVAAYPAHAQEKTLLIEAADKALYEAKRSGKNCVAYA
ncbi:MAG: sensor domain-containing diguanylate cyclase [Candidatus Omnitrophica bacterium]|nr:sensor domain-containing diguanylate cyclase [Candidatus Omnitrophota bacterium]